MQLQPFGFEVPLHVPLHGNKTNGGSGIDQLARGRACVNVP